MKRWKGRVSFLGWALLFLACLPVPGYAETSDEMCAAVHRPNLEAPSAVVGRVWSMGATVHPCGKWRNKNTYRSGSYNVHRYPISTHGPFDMVIRIEHQEGAWLPDLVLATDEGAVLYRAGVTTEIEGVNVRVERPSDNPRSLRLEIQSERAHALFLYVTDVRVAKGNTEAELPRDARYRVHLEQSCTKKVPRPCPIAHPDVWNTFYFFADERDYPGRRTVRLNDRNCRPLARVSAEYSDVVCIQGSGLLRGARVINFYSTCACGRPCPTGGTACYVELDRQRFPWGMGSRGNPLFPLRSIAVDNGIVPHGALVYIAEWDGMEIPTVGDQQGFVHDGCFRADDIGGGIKNNHIDIFAGSKPMYERLETLFPTRSRFAMQVDVERCKHLDQTHPAGGGPD